MEREAEAGLAQVVQTLDSGPDPVLPWEGSFADTQQGL